MRKFDPRELTELIKFGIDPFSVNQTSIPVEYITEKALFYNRYFKVNKNVLIPRIETEEIISIVVKNFKKKKNIFFADVGTGSGAIGITLFLELNKTGNATGYLSDISEKALKIARDNAKTLIKKLDKKVQNFHFIKSDLFNNFPEKLKKKLDFIVANLPYIPKDRISKLPQSVKNFEPYLALNGGEDGLTIIKKFLKIAPLYLANDGIIILEVDDSHCKPIPVKGLDAKVQNDANKKLRFWIYTSAQKKTTDFNQ